MSGPSRGPWEARPRRDGAAPGPDARGDVAGARAVDDLAEAAAALARQRLAVAVAEREAEERRRRAVAHAGGPADPRAHGLWDAAAFHAERARAARARLDEVEALAREVRARAAASRQGAGSGGTGSFEERAVRRCG